jgi:hypothetical protein
MADIASSHPRDERFLCGVQELPVPAINHTALESPARPSGVGVPPREEVGKASRKTDVKSITIVMAGVPGGDCGGDPDRGFHHRRKFPRGL